MLLSSILLNLLNQLHSQKYQLSDAEILIPSKKIPSGLTILRSNNNLDIVEYNNKYYVAFRTASHHFPNRKARIHIISTEKDDFNNWKHEHTIFLNKDLREPRFAVINDKLLLYFFEGAKSPIKFDPNHVWVSELINKKQWVDKIIDGLDGYVPWRIKLHNNKLLLSAYWGKNLYGDHQGDLRLFESSDGYNWKPISKESQIVYPGAEEGEFEFDENGNLWACVRLEGEGAFICYANKDSLDHWNIFKSEKKYDSSCMFRHKNDIYLIARRNLDGKFSKKLFGLPQAIKRIYSLIRYSLTGKTTALYKLNKQRKDFDWVMDLPGCGDNAFPAIAKKNENTYIILNYSNDFENPDISWLSGQLSNTFIYSIELQITE